MLYPKYVYLFYGVVDLAGSNITKKSFDQLKLLKIWFTFVNLVHHFVDA